mmetsp:Transcript_7621/g.21342  ORF Transcript_7621/g.21342 Transcript_7621/m.21342 type:complete len:260 (+) Transcript_7621:238-1017(+)
MLKHSHASAGIAEHADCPHTRDRHVCGLRRRTSAARSTHLVRNEGQKNQPQERDPGRESDPQLDRDEEERYHVGSRPHLHILRYRRADLVGPAGGEVRECAETHDFVEEVECWHVHKGEDEDCIGGHPGQHRREPCQRPEYSFEGHIEYPVVSTAAECTTKQGNGQGASCFHRLPAFDNFLSQQIRKDALEETEHETHPQWISFVQIAVLPYSSSQRTLSQPAHHRRAHLDCPRAPKSPLGCFRCLRCLRCRSVLAPML